MNQENSLTIREHLEPNSDQAQFVSDLGPIQSYALRCIRCGFCNAVCPTSNVASAFKDSRTSRGRMALIQSLVQGAGKLEPYSAGFKELIDLCYSCRRCVPVCPAGIPIPDLNSHARHAYLKRKGATTLTLGHRIFANYGTFDRLASIIAPASNWILRRHFVRMLMQWTTHIDSRALLPSFRTKSFESWFRSHPMTPSSKKIVYFVDSYANYNDPALGKMTVALLERLGYEVILPPQKESGMPAVEYGMLDKARELAEYNIEHLAPYAQGGIRILCTSLAAAYLLKDGYKTFVDDPNLSVVSGAVIDIAEFLHREYKNGNLRFQDGQKQQAKYHVCCLSKTLATASITRELLQAAGEGKRQSLPARPGGRCKVYHKNY
jgi:glycerol-3-phosphate dehydrogenase subunit C